MLDATVPGIGISALYNYPALYTEKQLRTVFREAKKGGEGMLRVPTWRSPAWRSSARRRSQESGQ